MSFGLARGQRTLKSTVFLRSSAGESLSRVITVIRVCLYARKLLSKSGDPWVFETSVKSFALRVTSPVLYRLTNQPFLGRGLFAKVKKHQKHVQRRTELNP